MSERSLRSTKKFDYKVFSETGEKVFKETRKGLQKMGTLIDDELKITCKFKRFMSENSMELLYDISDIESAIQDLRNLLESYEEIHIRLKRELGDEYDKTFPNFEQDVENMSYWIRTAKLEIKRRKQERSDKEKVNLRAEVKIFSTRITRELDNIDEEGSNFMEDLERYAKVVQGLIDGYSNIFVRVEQQGSDFSEELQGDYEEQCSKLSSYIVQIRKKIQNIRLENIEIEKERKLSLEKQSFEQKKTEKVNLCMHIFENISDRLTNIEKKCDVDLSKFSDIQILEKKNELKTIDSAFNNILDKILRLSEANPSSFKETRELMDTVNDRKERLKIAIDELKENLELYISQNDLSEEKVKNASLLGIHLQKFKGYDSTMDFYTFKSEFEKLVSPKVKAALLPDYLKKNYLDGQALQLVKEIEDLDEIWQRLKMSYGEVGIILSRKLQELEKGVPLWKIRGDEKIIQSIISIKNSMMELRSLAKKHAIEHSLFHTSNLAKIYNLLGRKRQEKIMEKILDLDKNEENIWDEIITFLNNELKVKEQVLSFERSNPKNEEKYKSRNENSKQGYNVVPSGTKKCLICGKSDHVPTITNNGHVFINYFSCEKFVKMNPKDRFEELKRKKLCLQCLTPGLKMGHEGHCFDRYKCPDESHNRYKSGLHILVCDRHKNDEKNLQLLELYKSKCISDTQKDFSKKIEIAFHIGDPRSYEAQLQGVCSKDRTEMAIYMLQTIKVGDDKLNIFFDSGCYDMVCSKRAVDLLSKQQRAKNVSKENVILSGVGDQKSVCEYGRFQITVPLHNGQDVNLVGICLDKITCKFPSYPLSEAGKEVSKDFASEGGDLKLLPKLPKTVGGYTDLMLGIQYFKYFPTEIHRMKNGLSISESQFISVDGSRGILGGPHKSFTEAHKYSNSNHANVTGYFTTIAQNYRENYRKSIDLGLLDVKGRMTLNYLENCTHEGGSNEDHVDHDQGTHEGHENQGVIKEGFNDENELQVEERAKSDEFSKSSMSLGINSYGSKSVPKSMKLFEAIERAGTEATYRCIKCRGCSDCKKSSEIECISLQEEIEQGLIEKSVNVYPDSSYSEAYFPFLCDPSKKLITNLHLAEKFYFSRVKAINSRSESDKLDLINAMKKLMDLGFIDKFENLTSEQRTIIDSSPVKYYIPWQVVWNANSVSTPCRPVFNASCPTDSGYSLNDLLPKGRNNLNKLVQIFLRWLIYACAFHTDIQKMYNTIRLNVKHWCYQLFLFNEELKVSVKPQAHVIKTLIYGVRTSGNQAERAVRKTADLCKDDYPRPNEIIQRDTYVDDCFSGEKSLDEAKVVTDNLQIVLSKGGFRLKGITFSGLDPPDHLCNDEKFVTVAGIKWFPKSDLLSLNIDDLDFAKKVRGKRPERGKTRIPEKFTRRECAGRVGEIFDLNGRFAPLIAEFKLDLSVLCTRKLDWDDFVPDDLVQKWKSNFRTISQLSEIKFKRCIVPEDALGLDMETIEMADASLNMACSVVYARFKRKNGLFSCQLIFARTKIIPSNMTIPRAELTAAALNATTGHIVYMSLDKYIKNRISLTDSQVTLFWINSTHGQLKQWPRNRVIEINRLTKKEDWFYIDSSNMSADIGTRRGAKLVDVLENSVWVNGHEWAKYEREYFPIKSVEDIKLSKEDLQNYNEETVKLNVSDTDWINNQLSNKYCESYVTVNKGVLDKVGQRYTFSKYIVDPNKFRFRKVVRIVALILLFVKNLKRKIGKSDSIVLSEKHVPSPFKFCNDKFLVTHVKNEWPFTCAVGLAVELTEENLLESLNYFYKKASLEIKHFQNKNSYVSISTEMNGILFYTGRILPSQRFENKLSLSDACIDLSMASFCVPLVDKHSPVAYAVINEVHWYDYDAMHAGNETVSRYVQKIAYIIEGKSLVRMFRNECPRCRYLLKKAVAVAMGPKSGENLSIAPVFYLSQVDIFGPYNSYSNVNKRATSKVWFIIFCCCVTGAVDIKVAEDYSTGSFILAFIRFSCKVGYPKKLLPDAGSQLVKGCNSMKLSFRDARNKLHEFGVELEVCPVGAHYMHGKVERKIKHVKESFKKHLQNNRLSIIQWETFGNQVSNSINNLPIGVGNASKDLENLDLLTPNRLLLARNNSRCPVGSVTVTEDVSKIIHQNKCIFEAWFRAWLTSYVPTLMFQPKWFKSDRDPKEGDVVLFLKSDKEFEKIYQYGIICGLKKSRDGKIRQIEVEYQNQAERVKRRTNRGTREIVVIHQFGELGLIRELNMLAAGCSE